MINRQMQAIYEDDFSELVSDPKRLRNEELEELLTEMKDAIQSAMETAAKKQRNKLATQNG